MRANIEWANDGENGARAGKKIEGQRGSRGAMNVNVGGRKYPGRQSGLSGAGWLWWVGSGLCVCILPVCLSVCYWSGTQPKIEWTGLEVGL